MPKGLKGFQPGHLNFNAKDRSSLYCIRGHYRTGENIKFDGMRPADCKLCRSERVKESGLSNSYYIRNFQMTKKYWMEIFEKQSGCCAICKRHQSETNRTLCVDHDHESGKIRGLLCRSCNLLIGNSKEDCSVLQRSIIYLKSWAGN